jgi:hypothetical protein
MFFLQKYVCGFFELPLLAEKRLKNALKKMSRKKSRLLGGWVWDLANARGGPADFVLPAPRFIYR